jgi:two-component sensor histidine kinase
MKDWLRGKFGGLAAFVLIAGLVAGGLGWATAAALRLEQEQRRQQAEAEWAAQLRVAMWRLDGRLTSLLAPENSRPFHHYSAIYAPPQVLDADGAALVPSPLLDADLPPWMRLHFQVDDRRWASPQVLSRTLAQRLRAAPGAPFPNATSERRELLAKMTGAVPAAVLLDAARKHAGPTSLRDRTVLLARLQYEVNNTINMNSQAQEALANSEYVSRAGQQSKLFPPLRNDQRVARNYALLNMKDNGAGWLAKPRSRVVPGGEATVTLSPLVGLWLPTSSGEQLLMVRLVCLEDKEVCQGIVLDGLALQERLAEEVHDLFPAARVLPVHETVPEEFDRTLTALPLRLDPGPMAPLSEDGWTPLRVGLALAWAAALVALLVVGLGGWSLIDLSQRRIRFVSAVTHELRTPLTTLRLYLDMLMNGMVRDEAQRDEYVRTLHAEADRLTRLVSNVLDFSRLENQRPNLVRAPVAVGALLEQVRATWQGRCQDNGKELLVEAPSAVELVTDGELLQQVLGNLIDNACKYSRESEDRRVWIRASAESGRVTLDVEDRGPGVPVRERRSIFQPFRRGASADVTAGGVGLGLALAKRWAYLLGGKLTLVNPSGPTGACFRVELPLA